MTELATTGARLKAERERRKLTAQKAADQLHLDGWVIEALEADDYQRIGPSVYAKGHLKRYADLLGLPVAEIMQGYESHGLLPSPIMPQIDRTAMPADAPGGKLPLPMFLAALGVALLLIGGMLLWWKPWDERARPAAAGAPTGPHVGTAPAGGAEYSGAADLATAAPPRSDPTLPPAATSAAPVSPAQAAVAATTGAAAPGVAERDANAGAGTGRVRLRMRFSADSWVDIHDALGHRAFAGTGRANSVRTIAGMAPMHVYLGFASGVQLEINNRAVAIGSQFVAGDVARFEAGADGVLRRDSLNAPGAAGAQARSARPIG